MTDIVEAAAECLERGYAPIPIVKGEKRPAQSDWTNLRYSSRQELEDEFEDTNLGLLLGDPSGGLIDIDLDAEHARILGRGFLPLTRMIHGRESSPASHYWYKIKGLPLYTERFKDPTDGELLLEIRSTGGQTLIPPSVHPSGESYEWQDEWHNPASVDSETLHKRVKWLAAASLLAKHWPGQGERHDAALCLAGGLLRIGDSELTEDAEAFVRNVAGAGGDEEAGERWRDVDSTKKRYKKKKGKVKAWKSLSKIMDPEVVRQVIEWLKVEDLDDVDEQFKRIRIAEYMNQEFVPKPMLVEDILYESSLTWLQGEPGKGKTLFALWLIKQVTESGHTVLFMDEESNTMLAAERLSALGADSDIIDRTLWYYEKPGINATDSEYRLKMNREIEELKPSLIVFDACADVLANSGLRENENDDINVFIKRFIEPITHSGIAVLMIDHMSKGAVDGGYARGAGSKKSKTDAAWTFLATKEFNKETMGRVRLKRAKDRFGQLPESIAFKMGGKEGSILVNQSDVVEQTTIPEDEYVLRIVQYLQEEAQSKDEAKNTTTILETVAGKREKLYGGLKLLESILDDSPIEREVNGTSHLWWYAGDLSIDWEGVVD